MLKTLVTTIALTILSLISPTFTLAAPTPFKSTNIDNIGEVGSKSDMAIRSNGLATIAYLDETNNTIKIALCQNEACTEKSVHSLSLSGANAADLSFAMELKNDLPLIAYRQASPSALIYIKCTTTNCETSYRTTLDSQSVDAGKTGIDIKIGGDGDPVIAYGYTHPTQGSSIKSLRCTINDFCTQTTISEISTGVRPTMYIEPAVAPGIEKINILSSFKETSNNTTTIRRSVCQNINCTQVINSPVATLLHEQTEYSMNGTGNFAPIFTYTTPNKELRGSRCVTDVTCNSSSGIIDTNVDSYSVGVKAGANIVEIASAKFNPTTSKHRLSFKKCQSGSFLCTTILEETIADSGSEFRGSASVGFASDIKFNGNKTMIVHYNATHKDLRYTFYSP